MLHEKDLGSLETGKLADFTILDKDYVTIPETEIHTIRSLRTAVGGKIVSSSSEYHGLRRSHSGAKASRTLPGITPAW